MKPAASPSRAPQVTAHAERALVRIQIMENPYLRALWDGSMSGAASGYLRRMGSDSRRLVHTAVWPELRAFNAVLTAACVLDELEVGIACMGVIEHAFAGISAAIGQAVVARGWVRNDRLIHYRLHAQVDERHAEEFFAVIEPCWRTAARRYYIEQGLELGAYIFDRLYRDLYERGARLRPGPDPTLLRALSRVWSRRSGLAGGQSRDPHRSASKS